MTPRYDSPIPPTEPERVDSIPVVLAILIRLGVRDVVDERHTPHGNRLGLSVGWLTTIFRQTEKVTHHFGNLPAPYWRVVPHFVFQHSPPIQIGEHDPPLDKMRFSWHNLVSGDTDEKQTDMYLDNARFTCGRRSAWLHGIIRSLLV